MKRRVLAIGCGIVSVLFAACSLFQASPYVAVRKGAYADGVPAPSDHDPEAYNYLPAVLVGECSEAEFPLFSVLNARPLEETRPLLEQLGMIRNHRFVLEFGSNVDRGRLMALTSRYHLRLRQDFVGREGNRVAWIFYKGPNLGTNGPHTPVLFLLTTADYGILTTATAQTLRASKPVVVSLAGDSISFHFAPNDAASPDHVRFSSDDIQVAPPTSQAALPIMRNSN